VRIGTHPNLTVSLNSRLNLLNIRIGSNFGILSVDLVDVVKSEVGEEAKSKSGI
jgi:hypothetical protein